MFKEVKIESIPTDGRSNNASPKENILDFYKSGIMAAEVVDISHYKTPENARSSYASFLRRTKIPVIVILRWNRLFMVRKETKKC